MHICSRSHARSTLADLTPNIRPAARFLVSLLPTTPGGALRGGTRKKSPCTAVKYGFYTLLYLPGPFRAYSLHDKVTHIYI